MKPETLNARGSCDPALVAQLESMSKTVTRAALDILHKNAQIVGERGTSVSTCIVAMSAELANMMANLDRDAAADVFELMAASIRSGQAPTGAERQRMYKVQQQLAHGEITLMARQSARGTA